MKKILLSLLFVLFLLPLAVMGQCGSSNLSVTDADGNSYTSLKIGPHCWMQSNLKTRVPGSSIYWADKYPDTSDNLAVYGRLYSWYAAMNIQPGQIPVVGEHNFIQGICPEGWHLPTDAEITQLATYSVPSLHDVHYWLVPGTNTTNYTMRPGGYYNANRNRSEDLCGSSYMWTAQSLDESSPSIVWSDCHCDHFLIDRTSASNGVSVRCVYKIYQGEVTTDSANQITSNSATLWGNVTFNGYAESYERGFVYGTDPDNLDQWVVENPAASDETAPFSKEITGLTVATTYYYQAYIINDFDTAYGEVKSFATKDLAVTTNDATDVKSTSATLNGELTKLKGYENANVGFRYGQHKNYMVFFAEKADPITTTGSYNVDLSSLSPNTTYYFQAYAYNETDTAWAVDTLSFRTLTVPCLGAVRTNERGTTDAIDSVIDNEGNAYIAVKIGNQCWMAQNLRTQNTNGYGTVYTNYDVVTYGRYYTWTAMMQGSASSETNPSGVRGICPEGWHIPSLSEWRQLSTYVKDAGLVCTDCSGTDDDERVNCIPNALASTIGWKDNSQICTPGCKLSNKNATGFSAVPAGYYNNAYLNFGEYAIYFMATTNNAKIYYSSVNYNTVAVHLIMTPDYFNGASPVRCLRDPMTVTTDSANTVTSNSAKLYGNVTSMGKYTEVNAGFKYGTSESALTSIASDESAMDATGRFSYTITDLTANTQYYFKAFAANGTDTVYGEVKNFTVLSVTTDSANTVTHNSAKLYGNVTSMGSYTEVKAGFRYGLSSTNMPNEKDASTNVCGAYNITVSPLYPDTTYYYQAYVANDEDTVWGEVKSFHISFACGDSLVDVDGNWYKTVAIGTQCWMTENMRTTKFPDGTSINLNTSYKYEKKKYRLYPNDNSANVRLYGYLYSWRAAVNGTTKSSSNPSGVQGLCPKGWHIPSVAEWSQMETTVDGTDRCSSPNTIAKAVASDSGWKTSSTDCAVGNNQSTNNSTGLTIVPAGRWGRVSGIGDIFEEFGNSAYIWTTTYGTGSGNEFPYYRYFPYDSSVMRGDNGNEGRAMSVRCVRNPE